MTCNDINQTQNNKDVWTHQGLLCVWVGNDLANSIDVYRWIETEK